MAKAAKKVAAKAIVEHTSDDAKLIGAVTTDAKAIGKMIAGIASVQATQRERVRIAAVCAIEYAIRYGNANFLTSLHEAIGSESRRNDFIKWCLNFGPVRWIEGKNAEGTKEQGKFGIDAKRTDEFKAKLDKDRIALLAPLVKLPYWEYIKEKPFEGITVAQLIQAAVQRLKSIHSDDEKSAHPDNNFEGEDELIALSVKYPFAGKKKKETNDKANVLH